MSKITFVLLTLLFVVATLAALHMVFGASPVAVGQYLVAQVGSAIGVTVSIPSNPFNMLAQQLAEKESTLGEKEKELQQKEAALEAKTNEKQRSQNRILTYGGVFGAVLFALILANFYFDWRKRKTS